MKPKKPILSHIVFSNYFDFLDDEGITTKDIVDFVKALRAFCSGDFDYKIQNRVVRAYMANIRAEMETRHKAYCRKLEILRGNSQKGGEANKRRLQALTLPKGKASRAQNITIFEGEDSKAENENFGPLQNEGGGGFPFREGKGKNEQNEGFAFVNSSGSASFKPNGSQMAPFGSQPPQKRGENGPFLGGVNSSGSASFKPNGSQMAPYLDYIIKNFKLSPHPPEAGGGAGAGVEFLENFRAFGAALSLDMPEGLEDAQSDLLRWHCSASDGPEILSAANEIAKASGGDSRALSVAISSLCQRVQSASEHSPMPRPLWRLFAKLLCLSEKPEGQRLGGLSEILQAFAAEVSRAFGVEGQSLWPILQEKADFAANNKVSNLGSFLRARK